MSEILGHFTVYDHFPSTKIPEELLHGELRPEQKKAVRELLGHDTGVLAATTAFGKTVVAAWMIAQVAVGTPVSRRSPHRSLRAELPHRAPTSGSDAQALFGIRVIDSHGW